MLHSILRPFRFFSDTPVFFPFVKIQDFILNAVGKVAAGFPKYQSISSACDYICNRESLIHERIIRRYI